MKHVAKYRPFSFSTLLSGNGGTAYTTDLAAARQRVWICEASSRLFIKFRISM